MIQYWKGVKSYLASRRHHPTRKNEQKQQYIILTYRSGIQKLLSTTYYQSDTGWGCMLRVGQMFIANLFYKIEKKDIMQVITLFYDNKQMPFSFPMITDTASIIYQDKKQYQWFSPCQCGFIIKNMLDRFDMKFRVSICNDNCIFLNEIQQDREMLIIIAMCRIGFEEPQPEYLNCLVELMGNQYFNSVMGGIPKRAHLFLKHVDGYLGYLDPHTTQKVPPYDKLKDKQKEYLGRLQWIKKEYIDCSMAIIFVVPGKDIERFWGSLVSMREKLGEGCFLYLEKEKPIYNDNNLGIIEIFDDDELIMNINEEQNQQGEGQVVGKLEEVKVKVKEEGEKMKVMN